ncbi:MAG: hypothetical protein JWR10_2161 [Rubritepida sp.]|nr:hypothetical protein [Rubritepida sp.]
MAPTERTKTALDECRMLMLGAQILLGFQLQAPFQNAFSELSGAEKALELAVLCLMVLVIGLLITPSARHRIVERGEATPEIIGFISRLSMAALGPFALALALAVGIAAGRIGGARIGMLAGLLSGAGALGLWYGPLLLPKKAKAAMTTSDEKTPAGAKIDFALTEARVVLPGAQALLGFQLAIVLTSGFAELPAADRALHGIALGLIALSTMLLMAPAAYHRIVYDGTVAEEFYRTASLFILAATVFLALGLTADIHVVAGRISGDAKVANVAAAGTAVALFGLWHAWPWLARARRISSSSAE